MGSKRRLVAYIILAVTLFLGIIVSATPVLTKLNPGREYTNGYQFVYQLREKEVAEDESNEVDNLDATNKVADEMRSRLETYQVEDYSVIVEGTNQVRVSITEKDETKLNYIRKYLAFSGANFSLSGKVEETRVMGEDIFKDVKAYIVRQQDVIPYVIIPVSDSAKVKTLIETVTASDENEEHANGLMPHRAGDSEDGGDAEKTEPDIFLWANWVEGDSYETAVADPAKTGQKILLSFNSGSIWYPDSENEETELQFLCGFGTAEDATKYDVTKLRQANQLATYYVNMFNASAYDYDVVDLFVTESASGVNYNTIRSGATLENILVYGTDVNLAWSATLYSSLLAIVIVSLILVYFYRLSALGIIANTVSSVYLTYLLFVVMGATFNIAAFIGGVLLAIVSMVTAVIYQNKFKEEVYKGRTLKKANQEATKKLNLLTLDLSVPTFIMGLIMYFVGGNALRPLGIILFFGAVIVLLMNLLVFRLFNYLLTNSYTLTPNYKVFNINEELIADANDESKEVYEGAYSDRDFTKIKKPVGIAALVLFVAAIAGGITFTALNGSALNVNAATSDYTQIYVGIRGEKLDIDTTEEFEESILKNVTIDGKALAYSSVDMETREEYDYKATVTTYYTYFITRIEGTFEAKNVQYTVGADTLDADSLDEAIQAVTVYAEGTNANYVSASTKVAHETVNTPNQGFILLATLIGVVASSVYLMLRYRPSKGVAALCVSLLAGTITYGALVLVRVPTVAITAIVTPVVALFALLISILLMSKTNEMYKEEKDLTLEKRKELGIKATALVATPILSLTAISAYLGINFFGFAPQALTVIFIGMLVGVILAALFTLVLSTPITNACESLLSKIHLPKIKRAPKREKIKLQKKNTSEPEETIIIGIND